MEYTKGYVPQICYFCNVKLPKIQSESFITACGNCVKVLLKTERTKKDFEFWALSQCTELWK